MNFNDVELPSNRKFGFFFFIVFFLFGLYFTLKYPLYVSYILFALSIVTLVTTLLKPEILLPFNKLWMKLGLLLGKIVSPIVLGIIFLFIFTLIGLMMKLFGRDELLLKHKNQLTHWKKRTLLMAQADSFKHQF